MKHQLDKNLKTWEQIAKLRDETHDSKGYHGERDTTLVPLGSNPMMRDNPAATAANVFNIIFQQSLKVTFAGNVATWQQVAPSVREMTVTVFEMENRKPGLGAMLAIAPTVNYKQRTVTSQIEQYRMSIPFDQFVFEYQDPQALALIALAQQQVLNILDADMTNSVLAAFRSAYMARFASPAEWLEETLEFGAVLNEKGFTGTEIVSLFNNIMPSAATRLLLATSETGFTAMSLPPVASVNNPGITAEVLDPASIVSILTRSLQTQGSRRTVDNLDIYGIPHYTNEHNANILQTAENIDSNVHLHGVLMGESIPEGTKFILLPTLSGLWHKLSADKFPATGYLRYTNKPFNLRGSDLIAGPIGAGRPLFMGKYWPTKSISNFSGHNGDGNILTMTGYGGVVTLPDQIAIGAAAYVLNVSNTTRQAYKSTPHNLSAEDYAENRAKLVDLTSIPALITEFDNHRTRRSEWKESIATNTSQSGADVGVGALLPFIAVREVNGQEVRTWVSGHPMFERLARMPQTSLTNKTLSKVIPTHNEFVATINTIGHTGTVNAP